MYIKPVELFYLNPKSRWAEKVHINIIGIFRSVFRCRTRQTLSPSLCQRCSEYVYTIEICTSNTVCTQCPTFISTYTNGIQRQVSIPLQVAMNATTLGLHVWNRNISAPSSNVSDVKPLVFGRRKWQSRPVVRHRHPITPSGTTAWASRSILMISGQTATPRYPTLVISPIAVHLQETEFVFNYCKLHSLVKVK